MTTPLHEERLAAVLAAVSEIRPTTVLDLGCGDGDLFLRLARQPRLDRLVGVDLCAAVLDRLRQRLARTQVAARDVELRLASLLEPQPDLAGFDCATLVEVIEHVDPGRLSQLERAVFAVMRPRAVVVTTPNAEFNPLLGVPARRFRHPDHRFEWDRTRFRAWALRIGAAQGYAVDIADIAGRHPALGGASQMAVLRRRDRPAA